MKRTLLGIPFLLAAFAPIHALADSLFFTDGGSVESANIDGSSRQTIYQYTPTGGYINYIALDTATQKLYYYGLIGDVNTGTPFVRVSNLDGSDMTQIITGGLGTIQYGFAVDPISGKMYIGDHYGVMTASLDGSNLQPFFPVPRTPDLRFYPHSLKPDDANSTLYYTDALVFNGVGFYGVGSVPLADGTASSQTLVNTGSTGSTEIALDLQDDLMYIATGNNTPGSGAIQRANLDGSGLITIVPNVAAYDVELDSQNGKLYWTTIGGIESSNLDGTDIENVLALNSPGPWSSDSLVVDVAPLAPVPLPSTLSLAASLLGILGAASLLQRAKAGRSAGKLSTNN